jgi:hypothetical protein
MEKQEEDQAKRIGQLEDELKIAQREIAILKINRDEAQRLADRMEESVVASREIIESWKEAFNMELGDDGVWRFPGNLPEQYDNYVQKYSDLLKLWNRYVGQFNTMIKRRNVGRPIGASEAQIAQVRKLRKAKMSIRCIVEETSLTMQTVRTILGKDARTDRTTIKRLERIDPDRREVIAAKVRKRTRDALPRRISETLKEGADLIKEAKGLG